MVKIRQIIILIFCFWIITSCQNAVSVINKDIPSHSVSVKEIVRLVDPHVKRYWERKEYHLGEIFMFLNEKLEGEVSLTYADESSKSSPNVIGVTVNTIENKIVSIKRMGSNSKIDPGRINFHKWKIDSDEAFRITEDIFKTQNGFQYDKVIIESNNIYHHTMEVWNVSIYNFNNKLEYWGTINPYTGEVIESGISKM
jgi:hypothetical protein